MTNIKIIIIIITFLIITIITITPHKKEHFPFEGKIKDLIGDVTRPITDLINNVSSALTKAINVIPNKAGVPDIVKAVENLVKTEPYIKTILLNIIKMNVVMQKVITQVNTDVGNIKGVAPVIKKCIQRIEYSHQRLLNISKCVSILIFMIKNKRPLYTIRATRFLMYNIIDSINYIRMAMRTTFIDLHNTDPPLWKVINGGVYKSSLVSIINYTKTISQNLNELIKITASILGNVKSFLGRELVRDFDRNDIKSTVSVFETMLKHMKILIIDIPKVNLDMDFSILYRITQGIIITSTIPPGKNIFENRKYIRTNIKHHPYG